MPNDKQPLSPDNYIGDELTLFAHAKNWKKYWSHHLSPFIKGSVLEVGAGIGSNLALLKKQEHVWTALEPDSKQADQIRASFSDQGDSIKILTGTLNNLKSQHRFDTILYIDVLEHIEHDLREVNNAFDRLEVNGKLIILSPAHQRLYSPFDKAVGHHRRYNKKTLSDLTPNTNDAAISELFYLDSVGCIASLANSALLKSQMPTPKQIWLWDSMMVPLSKIVDRLLGYRLGKTVVIVWTKLESNT